MILLDVTVNGKPAVLLLDTGGRYSIVRPELAKGSRSRTVRVEDAVYGSRKFSEVRIGREVKATAAVVDVRAASGASTERAKDERGVWAASLPQDNSLAHDELLGHTPERFH